MWSQYGRTDASLAVQSTVGRLLNSITDQERVFAGTVTYTDYDESTFAPRTTLMRPLLLKRNSFAHEHELRCLVSKLDANFASDGFDKDSMPTGVRIAVDVDKLVERVHVAPMLPTWVRETVDSVLRRYKLSASVEQSALDAEPIF